MEIQKRGWALYSVTFTKEEIEEIEKYADRYNVHEQKLLESLQQLLPAHIIYAIVKAVIHGT